MCKQGRASSVIRCLAWSLISPARWRGRSLLVVVVLGEPILLGIVQGVDHLGHQLIRLGYVQHRARILVSAAVVSRREHCEQLTPSKSLEPVHHTLMRTQYVFRFIVVEELFDAVGAELDDVAGAVGVSDKVGLDAQFKIIVGGVAPQNVDYELLLRGRYLVDNLERSLDHLDLLDRHQSRADAAMQTHDFILDQSRKREPVEKLIDFVEHTVGLGRVFTQTVRALLGKTKGIVYPLVLMVASQQMYLVWVFDLQSHQ